MSSSTSDKVGGVACVILAIVAAIIVLWPSLSKKKKVSEQQQPDKGTAPVGPLVTAGAPPPPAAPAADFNPTGVQALASIPINGDTSPGQIAPRPVANPDPKTDPAAVVVRLLGDNTVII